MECPLCHTKHPLLVKGIVRDLQTDVMSLVADRGYAFCNCRNIFFTDWSNIDHRIYDQAYYDKYQFNQSDKIYEKYATKYFPLIIQLKDDIKTFCEIGSINTELLDKGKKDYGWNTLRLDINAASNGSEHSVITGDIENPEIVGQLQDIDLLWMSHLVEHLKDPISTMKNVYNCLSDDGLVFVGMPDPYYIDWAQPSQWGHWVVREHHILWDMDSFIELMDEIGFDCKYAWRNLTQGYICTMDYHLIFQKRKNV